MKKATKFLLAGLGVVGIPFTGGLSAVSMTSALVAGTVGSIGTATTLATTGVIGATVVGVKKHLDNQKEKARREGFRSGQMSGEQDTYEKVKDMVDSVKYNEEYLIALITVGKYVAGIDGDVSEEEMDELNLLYNMFMKMPNITVQTRNKLTEIIESDVSMQDFYTRLLKLKKEELISLDEIVENIICADGETTKEEEDFLKQWKGIVSHES